MEQHKEASISLTWLLLSLMISPSIALNVLMMAPFGTPSHQNTLKELGNELVARGHQVSIVGSYKMKVGPNMTFIHTKTPGNIFGANFELAPLDNAIWNQYPLFWVRFLRTVIMGCDVLYDTDIILELVQPNSPMYDIIIIDSLIQECVLPLAHKLGKPIVFFTAGSVCPATSKQLGIPLPFSYVPHFMTSLTSEMTFYERTLNAISHFSWIIVYEWWYYPAIDHVTSKYLPGSPPVTAIIRNISVAMGTADGIFAAIRPTMPFFIDVGGIQCKPAKPLPQEFETIVSKANNGFIVFSLGSAMDGLFFTPKVRQAFMDGFARLKQVVFWKHHGEEEKLPSNVKLFTWLPQQDLLGHQKIRAFITHGGIHGLYEAIYHGVPVIGLGIFGDQKANLVRAVHKGLAVTLDETNITAESVYRAVSSVVNEPSYKASAQKLSSLLRDQPQTPMDRALFWIEYVARHGGAEHFRSPGAELSFYQYFLIDVLVVAVIGLAIILGIIFTIARTTTRFMLQFRKPQPKKHNKLS